MSSTFLKTLLVYSGLFLVSTQPMQQSVQLFEVNKKPSPDDTQLAAAEDVGKQVQAVLLEMNKETPKGLHLKSAVLSIQTGNATEKSVELTFVIFTLSHKSKMGTTQTTVITFGKQEIADFQANFAPPTFDQQFKQQLDRAIAVANEVKVFGTSQISTKVEFVVSKDTSGGLTFSVSGPFGVGKSGATLKYDKTKTSTNSLDLVYK